MAWVFLNSSPVFVGLSLLTLSDDFKVGVFENTALLAALIHPNHIVYLCSWGSRSCRLTVIPITLGIGAQMAWRGAQNDVAQKLAPTKSGW